MDLWRGLRFAFEEPPFLVGVTGAGGKTTLVHRLAQAAAAAGCRVLVTTTTRWWARQWQAFPAHILVGEQAELARAASRLAPGQVLAAAGQREAGGQKVRGIPSHWVDALLGTADIILVEADGARERPLKAPGPHEPALPERCTHVLPVAGWQGAGQLLSAAWVHRPERFARLAGLAPGQPITPEGIARALAHPEGGLKGVPPQAIVRPVLNQVDTADRLTGARRAARLLLDSPRVDAVAITSLQGSDPVVETHVPVAAVVLAAGEGARFGGAKQVALWQGRPLIHHVLSAAAALPFRQVIVVLGAHADQVHAAVEAWQSAHPHTPVHVVHNPAWQEGQSTSVKAALAHLKGIGAALFLLADQPRVPPSLLDALMTAHRRTMALAVVPRYEGRPGSPVLFDARAFPELKRLQGDVGGRVAWQAHQDEVVWVDWPEPHAAHDVDTPEDLGRL